MKNGMVKFIFVILLAFFILAGSACGGGFKEEGLHLSTSPKFTHAPEGIDGGIMAPGLRVLLRGENLGPYTPVNPFDPPFAIYGWQVKVCGELARLNSLQPDGLSFIIPLHHTRKLRSSSVCAVEVYNQGIAQVSWTIEIMSRVGWLERSEVDKRVAGFYILSGRLQPIEGGVIRPERGKENKVAFYARGWGYESVGGRVTRDKSYLNVYKDDKLLAVYIEESTYFTGSYGGFGVIYPWEVFEPGVYRIQISGRDMTSFDRYIEVK